MSARAPIPENFLPRFEALLTTLPLRDRLLIRMGMDTGFRIRELLDMTIGHVANLQFLPNRDVVLERRNLKFGRGVKARKVRARRVPLSPSVQDLVGQYLFERFGSGPAELEIMAQPLFPSRKGHAALTPRQALNIVQGACQKAGLDPEIPVGTHSLRKTFARRIYASTGYDINLTRASLGHANIETTQRYLAATEDEAYSAISRAVAPSRAIESRPLEPAGHASA